MVDAGGDPEAFRTGMGVDHPLHDVHGHAGIGAVHDGQEGCFDAPGRGDRVDVVGVEAGTPFRGPDRQGDDRHPGGQAVEQAGVVYDVVAIRVVGGFDDDGAEVILVGGGQENGHRAHGMAHQDEAAPGQVALTQVLHPGADVVALQAAQGSVRALARAVASEIEQENGVPTLLKEARVAQVALQRVAEAVDDDGGGLPRISLGEPGSKLQAVGREGQLFEAGGRQARGGGAEGPSHHVGEREGHAPEESAAVEEEPQHDPHGARPAEGPHATPAGIRRGDRGPNLTP
jgi:hypothetical protein